MADAIYVCVPIADNCCCGHIEKENKRIDWNAWRVAWDAHPVSRLMPLVPTKCLGPCGAANVLLVRYRTQNHWLGSIENEHMQMVFDYALSIATSTDDACVLAMREYSFEPEGSVAPP